MKHNDFNKADELGRRQFMINAARSYLGVTVAPMLGATLATPAFAQAAKGRAKPAEHVIFLNMAGGMSHLDTFDLKPGKDVQGPVEGISTKGEFALSQYLPKMAGVADKMCVINSMTSQQGAHEQGQYMLHSSYSQRGTITHPSIGSWVVRLKGRKNATLPGFVSVGGSPRIASSGFMGAEYAGVPLGRANEGLKDSKRAHTVSEEDFDKRLAIADALNKKFHEKYNVPQVKAYESLYDEAVKLMKSADLEAFDINRESGQLREEYGSNNFGQGCLLARRLVETGVRFVEVTLGGWDTHYDNFTAVEARANVLDQGFTALIKDLSNKGLLDSTLVVIATEFGRSPNIVTEHNNGRDHHPACFSTVVAGGGVKGGTTYGKSDKNGNRPDENPVTLQDLNATIGYALGLDHSQVIYSPSGRPFRMGGPDESLGSPVTSIFA
ncbi:DUF1501 domain-containing protein [Roseibacillus ishigakijimensis]|uniref:DUF1501 domain-containing protein n=1 Tax=Roseibacillus ishigakijimensis TaxID=454146 RepID=A0A934RM86_9BACT|nr:DUF1501 domain-containing protein [Roseibacillus ishigakijimensis]MBK1833969.1 DUF1501 domain-containing protein [Roseibacillus ishigakijimensis]